MVYRNPNARWSTYTRILLQPVECWDSSDSPTPTQDEQTLMTYFYNQLKETLQKNFTMVDQPGLAFWSRMSRLSTRPAPLRFCEVAQSWCLRREYSMACSSWQLAVTPLWVRPKRR